MFVLFSIIKSRQSAEAMLSVALMLGWQQPAGAGVEVQYDVPLVVECKEVIAPHDGPTNLRLVEAQFPVSVRTQGEAERLLEWTVSIRSSERRLRVQDYSPRTTLTSEHAEPITITKTRDKAHTVGASLGVGLAVPGAEAIKLTPAINGQVSGRNATTETHKKKPPQFPVVISGTMQAAHGVFFNLKPSTQTTLQGDRPFTVQFAVPETWQGDWVEFRFEWVESESQFWKKTPVQYSATCWVGLYLAGNDAAHQAALHLAEVQLSANDAEAAAGNPFQTANSPIFTTPLFSARPETPPLAPQRKAILRAQQALGELSGLKP